VTFKHSAAIVAFVVLGFSTTGVVQAAEKEETRLAEFAGLGVPVAPMSGYVPALKRPAGFAALYVTLGAMQAWDVYSTRTALKAGAREANPTTAGVAGNAGSLIALKAVTTAGTILFAERMWKRNKVGAIVMLIAVNSATAAVSMHNMRNAKTAASRR